MPSIKQYMPPVQSLNAQNLQAELAKANLGKTLSKAEATWVKDVHSKFGADPAVSKRLGELLEGVHIPNPALIASTLAALGRGGSNVPVSTGGGAGSTTTIGTQTGGMRPQATNTLDVVHFAGASSFPGDYKFKAGMLDQWYGGVAADKFGTTTVQLGNGQSFLVHDMQYDLGNGEVGMRFIPVADTGKTVVDKAGKTQPGGKILDDFLRKEMGLGPDEPIYAFLSYVHPETFEGDMKSLGGEKLKTEMGNTHLGAYLGAAKTSNSPENYHGHTFEVVDGSLGYPTNVTIISMEGVKQSELNKNLRLVDGTLNTGVKFPGNYKEDIFRTIDLPTTMLFYKDWINEQPYLSQDNSWKTYCAEHKTITGNVACNLPHNEAAFKEMFGADGAALWAKFKQKYEARESKPFTAADETSFEPLWKKEGMKLSDVQPWKDKAEYDAYDTARRSGNMSAYTGRVPPEPGKGMMWPPETTADLMCDFVESYVSFKQAGGFAEAAALLGFKDTITERMGMGADKFMAMTVPVINKMMIAEAMATAPGQTADGWMKKASATLFALFGGPAAPAGPAQQQIQGLVDACLQGVKAQINNIVASPVPPSAEQARAGAHKWLRDSVQLDIEKARRISVTDPSKVEFYSPPAVVNRVVLGMQEKSRFITLRTVCTAVEGDHMEPK